MATDDPVGEDGAGEGTGDDARVGLEPQEAFALVGHETRFAILRALWEAEADVVSFSALREAIGMRDSGNFNYHLGKLVGPFVRKVDPAEADDPVGDSEARTSGYELTVAAYQMMGAIESGAYHRTDRVGPVPVSGRCSRCGGDLEALYEDSLGRVRCRGCDADVFTSPMPAGAVAAYEPADLPDLFDRWLRALLRRATARICPHCTGRLDGELGSERAEDPQVGAAFRCRRCDQTVGGSLSVFFVEHPAVVAFLAEHGHDPRETAVWEAEWLLADDVEELVEADPQRAVVRVHLDAETLELVVDDSLEVVETRRVTA